MSEIYLLAGTAVVSVALVAYALWPARKENQEHVLRRMAGKRQDPSLLGTGTLPHASAARQMLEAVTPYAIRPVMPSEADMSTLRERLSQAGFRRESATRYFLASKTIIAIGIALIAVLVAWGRGLPAMQMFGVVAFVGGVGFMLPNFWLSLAVNQRSEKIRNGLPDSLDLLVVSVESGLALDAGLQRVSDEMGPVHPELSEELQIASLETQMGVPRSESLENMGRRCGVDEVQSLVAVITQSERFGTSVAKALRTQADVLRTKRRLRAEERAQKTAVKLMVPLMLCIFPSIFVVMAGPAALKIIEAFTTGPMAGK